MYNKHLRLEHMWKPGEYTTWQEIGGWREIVKIKPECDESGSSCVLCVRVIELGWKPTRARDDVAWVLETLLEGPFRSEKRHPCIPEL